MKRLVAILLAPWIAYAGEVKLPDTIELTKIDPVTNNAIRYTGVSYQSHDGAYLQFRHVTGLARVRIADLQPELQDALDYSKEGETAALEAERARVAEAKAVIASAQNAARETRDRAERRKNAAEARFRVVQVLEDGTLFVQVKERKPVAGSMGSVGGGGNVGSEWTLSDRMAFVTGAKTEFGEGEELEVTAYDAGTLTKIDVLGASRTLRHYVVVDRRAK